MDTGKKKLIFTETINLKYNRKYYKIMENNEVRKGKIIWIIIGFLLAPLGGIIGLIIGSNYAYGNFDRQTKLLGWIMIIISVISMAVITNN